MASRGVVVFLVAICNLRASDAIVEEYYTTNAVCRTNFCINPVFPGLHKLDLLEEQSWQKYDLMQAGQYLNFCKAYISYNFALPVIDYSHKWNTTAHTLEDRVNEQEQEAANLFFFHVSAMGLDAWDYPNPEEDSRMPYGNCVRQVARMACFTYLPQANPALSSGMATRYFKPCKSSCENYVKACNVECCDDSVKCVFTRSLKEEKKLLGEPIPKDVEMSEMQVAAGYVDLNGPSLACTGGAFGYRLGTTVALLLGFILSSS